MGTRDKTGQKTPVREHPSSWDETLCPIARAADIIADRYVILILRELRMGNDRFDGLHAQTGMSSRLLVQRLKMMESNGLIQRELYFQHPKRYRYIQTPKARELDTFMLHLRLWGMRHCCSSSDRESAVTMVHKRTGNLVDKNWRIPEEDVPFSFSQVETRINSDWAAERDARAKCFFDAKKASVARRRKATLPKKSASTKMQ